MARFGPQGFPVNQKTRIEPEVPLSSFAERGRIGCTLRWDPHFGESWTGEIGERRKGNVAIPSRDIGTRLNSNSTVAQPTVLARDPSAHWEQATPEAAVIRARIEAFVRAYNEAVRATNDSKSTDAAASLADNGTESAALSRLNGLPTSVPPGVTEAATLLSGLEIGISVGRDGTLTIDCEKLTAALDDPRKRVGERFANGATVSGSTGRKGIGIELEAHYRQALGALYTMIASMAETRDFLQQQLADPTERKEFPRGNH